MAKKSTRILSLILSMILLVSMLSCIALAQYDYSKAQNGGSAYKVNYNIVGMEKQKTPGVYVINANWTYDEDNPGEDVTFTFRGQEYTEKWDPNRHFATMAAVKKHIDANAPANPVVILTEGVYSFNLATRYNITILGPKAGYDPNVRHEDPTLEWELSADRYLPGAAETDTHGEAVLRPNSDDKMIKIDNDGNKDATVIVDGVVFQGAGAGVGDETYRNGGSLHRVYVQNSILDNAHAPIGRGSGAAFGFDMRNAQEHEKHLYFINNYIINQNTKPLYSGHANVVSMDGCSYQRSTNQPFNTVNPIQWQGQRTKITNSHFWNPEGVSVISGGDTGYFLNVPNATWNGNKKEGNDDVEFSVTVTNNTFYNVGSPSRPMFRMGVAGNSIYKVEDNTFIDTENHSSHTVFQLQYISFKGSITHNGIGGGQDKGEGALVDEGYYFMDDSMISVRNNTFIGPEYQNILSIGKNTHPNTKIEQTGNLYLDSLDSEVGNIVQPALENSPIYNKWVWLDAAMTQKSSEIFDADISIKAKGEELSDSGYYPELFLGDKEYSLDISVSTNAENGSRVYQSDDQWTKGATVSGANGNYTLTTKNRTNYYIVSITSVDGKTELDYHLTLHRAANPDAQLLDLLAADGQDIQSITKTATGYDVELGYYQNKFTFKPVVSVGARVTVRQGINLVFADSNGNYSTPELAVGASNELTLTVKDSNNLEEVFIVNVRRALNNETALLDVECEEALNGVQNKGNNTFFLEVAPDTFDLDLVLPISPNATATLKEPVYQSSILGKKDKYSVKGIPAGENTYTLEVVSQDGLHSELWKIIIKRNVRTGCELIDILGAQEIDGVYYAFTANKNYMVSAQCSSGASYKVYSDADCTKAYAGTYIKLEKATTALWIRVIAEDGLHKSIPVKLVVSSYADFGQVENGVMKFPEVVDPYTGAISIDGGQFHEDGLVVIPLANDKAPFEFQARPRNGFSIRLMSDDTKQPMRPDETKGDNVAQITLKPDAGITTLYAEANKGAEKHSYTIVILSPKKYAYSDKQTDWAKNYIQDVATNGFGLMKGDQNGKFNGEQNFTRYEMATLMVRVIGANAPLYASARNPFTDLANDHWAANYVKAAYRISLIKGIEVESEDGKVRLTYQGDKAATRSEFFRIYANTDLRGQMDVDDAYKAEQATIDAYITAQKFNDIEEIADWAKPAVYFMVYRGLVQGSNATVKDNQGKDVQVRVIKPEANITRNEVATILSRNLGTIEEYIENLGK